MERELKYTEEEFQNWKNDRITKLLLNSLEELKTNLTNLSLNDNYLIKSDVKEYAHTRGQLHIVKQILDVELEHIVPLGDAIDEA